MANLLADPVAFGKAVSLYDGIRSEAMRPAGAEGVRQIVGKRFALYPQPNRTPEMWAAWWEDYIRVLARLTWHALERAMQLHVESEKGEFLPKPGRLKTLATEVETAPARAASRIRRAMDAADGLDRAERIRREREAAKSRVTA